MQVNLRLFRWQLNLPLRRNGFILSFPYFICVLNMDFFDVVANRRSIRAFKNQSLPPDALERILNAAISAPSAGNAQPWQFVVVEKSESRLALSQAAYGQKSLQQAAAVIVVCADEKAAEDAYGPRGKILYCYQDTAAAVENILLSACALGLGTCWVGAFREEEVRKVISCPEHVRPVAMVPVGVPAELPAARPRRQNMVFYRETF
jgi:nitroreductase